MTPPFPVKEANSLIASGVLCVNACIVCITSGASASFKRRDQRDNQHMASFANKEICIPPCSSSQSAALPLLLNRIDFGLIERLSAVEEKYRTQTWGSAQASEFWTAIGTHKFRLLHLLQQAYILREVAQEIRKQQPELFEFEERMLAGTRSSLIAAASIALVEAKCASIYPKRKYLGAKMAATVFSHLAAEVNNIVDEYHCRT